MSKINRNTQTQGTPLKGRFGGTGNDRRWGTAIYGVYSKDTAGSFPFGSLVRLRHAYNDWRVELSTTVDDPNVVGVVIGTTYGSGENIGDLEWGAIPSNTQAVAVGRFGQFDVAVGSNGVTRGHYVYSVGSNGQAYGKSTRGVGAIGKWISTAGGSNTVRANIGHTADESAFDVDVSLNFLIDGGGAAITTGQKGHVKVDFPCAIVDWTLLADTTGSLVVDVWKDTYANFPPSGADSITASAKPTITGSTKATGPPTGWTTTIASGDVLAFTVDSASTITRATLDLKLRRSG
jgi:hypothetical protein